MVRGVCLFLFSPILLLSSLGIAVVLGTLPSGMIIVTLYILGVGPVVCLKSVLIQVMVGLNNLGVRCFDLG